MTGDASVLDVEVATSRLCCVTDCELTLNSQAASGEPSDADAAEPSVVAGRARLFLAVLVACIVALLAGITGNRLCKCQLSRNSTFRLLDT